MARQELETTMYTGRGPEQCQALVPALSAPPQSRTRSLGAVSCRSQGGHLPGPCTEPVTSEAPGRFSSWDRGPHAAGQEGSLGRLHARPATAAPQEGEMVKCPCPALGLWTPGADGEQLESE